MITPSATTTGQTQTTYYVLIDFDNHYKKLFLPIYSTKVAPLDCLFYSRLLVSRILPNVLNLQKKERFELNLRFYSGWRDESGGVTILAKNLSAAIRSEIVNLPSNVKANAVLAEFPIVGDPQQFLYGTLRGRGQKMEQKMVDTLITSDIISLAHHGCNIILFSDDEDMLPGIITASAHKIKMGLTNDLSIVRWHRTRNETYILNPTTNRISGGLIPC